jgi:hypothetical protein
MGGLRMTQEEHLKKIVAKCRELLAGAEKRTPGKWIHDKSRGTIGDVATEDLDAIAQTQERISVQVASGRIGNNKQRDLNADFIANCAGPAEAGWRATIAAIELHRQWQDIHDTWDWDCGVVAMFESQKKAIIAAWPEELL